MKTIEERFRLELEHPSRCWWNWRKPHQAIGGTRFLCADAMRTYFALPGRVRRIVLVLSNVEHPEAYWVTLAREEAYTIAVHTPEPQLHGLLRDFKHEIVKAIHRFGIDGCWVSIEYGRCS